MCLVGCLRKVLEETITKSEPFVQKAVWLLTRGGHLWNVPTTRIWLGNKFLVFWIGGCLQEMVAYGVSSVQQTKKQYYILEGHKFIMLL